MVIYMIKQVYLLGSSDAMKPKIILEKIITLDLLNNYKIFIVTDSTNGHFYNFSIQNKLKIVLFDDIMKSNYEIEEKSILISCGWPHMISNELISKFSGKIINCHGSYLPDYRGSRAYMHYWANIEDFYGATIHYVNSEFDDGNILAQYKIKLFPEESPEVIHYRTAELCALLLPQAIQKVSLGDEGKAQEGLKRYFFKTSIENFKQIRDYNEHHQIKIMTKNKVIK